MSSIIISEKIFKRFNIEKYILDNVNTKNSSLVIDTIFYIIEETEVTNRYGARVDSVISMSLFFEDKRLIVDINKSVDNCRSEKLVSKSFGRFKNYRLYKKMSILLKKLKNEEISEGEQEVINDLPVDFMRECSIDTILD